MHWHLTALACGWSNIGYLSISIPILLMTINKFNTWHNKRYIRSDGLINANHWRNHGRWMRTEKGAQILFDRLCEMFLSVNECWRVWMCVYECVGCVRLANVLLFLFLPTKTKHTEENHPLTRCVQPWPVPADVGDCGILLGWGNSLASSVESP